MDSRGVRATWPTRQIVKRRPCCIDAPQTRIAHHESTRLRLTLSHPRRPCVSSYSLDTDVSEQGIAQVSPRIISGPIKEHGRALPRDSRLRLPRTRTFPEYKETWKRERPRRSGIFPSSGSRRASLLYSRRRRRRGWIANDDVAARRVSFAFR